MFAWSSSEILTGYGTDWMTVALIKSDTLRNTEPSFIPDGTALRGAEAPLFHGCAGVVETHHSSLGLGALLM